MQHLFTIIMKTGILYLIGKSMLIKSINQNQKEDINQEEKKYVSLNKKGGLNCRASFNFAMLNSQNQFFIQYI